MRTWADDILGGCSQVADAIDAAAGSDDHAVAVAQQRRKVERPGRTPSVRVLAAMRDQRAPFFRFALNQSATHRRWFATRPLPAPRSSELATISEQSRTAQARLENAEADDFDSYLTRYLKLPAA